MAVASLVLGIVALVFSFFGVLTNWLSLILGIVGIALGAVGKKDPAKSGMATAGIVLSIIAVILSLLVWVVCIGCTACSSCVMF